MTIGYESVAAFAQTWGLVFLVAMFAAVLAYALWPGNKDKFEAAARSPLEEDETCPTPRR
jgi:cytochrome c oxidase cbb3-type subunit 4